MYIDQTVINKYTIIKVSLSDFGFQDKNNIPSHIPDFINLPSCLQEKCIRPQDGTQLKLILHQEGAPQFSKSKVVQYFPVPKNRKNSNPAHFPEASTIEDMEDPCRYNIDA